MGLDNVAVQWPRTGRFYDPVAPAEFVDFGDLADKVPDMPGPAGSAVVNHLVRPIRAYSPPYRREFGTGGSRKPPGVPYVPRARALH